MSLISQLFGKSPFGPLVEHARKVHECASLVRPLLAACIAEQYEEIHRLQDKVSKLEYEADMVKQEIRDQLPRRYFLPVARADLERFLHTQDSIADAAEDFAVVLLIRNTRIHPELVDEFVAFADQVVRVSETLAAAAEELEGRLDGGLDERLARAGLVPAEGEVQAVLARLRGVAPAAGVPAAGA